LGGVSYSPSIVTMEVTILYRLQDIAS